MSCPTCVWLRVVCHVGGLYALPNAARRTLYVVRRAARCALHVVRHLAWLRAAIAIERATARGCREGRASAAPRCNGVPRLRRDLRRWHRGDRRHRQVIELTPTAYGCQEAFINLRKVGDDQHPLLR